MCTWLVMGFLVGLLARAVMPGTQQMGCIATTLLGIAGSAIGGVLVTLWRTGKIRFTVIDPSLGIWPFIGAVVGAMVLLFIGGVLGGKRR